jgi:hypothetical protein
MEKLKMETNKPLITPQMKVGELLQNYPELESTLISLAPAFAQLKNPILRKTLAKVTSISQAARVGGISVAELIGKLRAEIDQAEFRDADAESVQINSSTVQPQWFDPQKIRQSLDARAMIESGEHPLGRVLADLKEFPGDAIYELITPFEPAPLIDKVKTKGFSAWIEPVGTNEYRTYFHRE